MTNIERKIIEFLVTGKTYSDEAIMKKRKKKKIVSKKKLSKR